MEQQKLPWLTAAVIAVVTCAAIPCAKAAGFADSGVTCYSWNGGNYSSGSFSKCSDAWVVAAKPAPVVPAPLAAPPTVTPVMIPMTCAPPPKPVLHKKKPAPVKC